MAVLLGCRASGGSPPAPARDQAYLFSYFTRNGDDGLHLAWSTDGTAWLPVNGGRSLVTPAVTGVGVGWHDWSSRAVLMRDSSILRGRDGTFHMV